MKKNQPKLTAARVRIILIAVLFLLFAAGVALFMLGKEQLTEMASTVSNKKADADASSNNLANLQLLQQRLAQYDDVPALVDELRVGSEFPQFAAVNNIRAIAERYNISISNISFAASTAGEGSSQAAAPAGTVQILFNIEDGVSYNTFLEFLNAIENNTPKLQVAGISLPDGSTANISPGEFTLTLYTKA